MSMVIIIWTVYITGVIILDYLISEVICDSIKGTLYKIYISKLVDIYMHEFS